MMEFDGLLLVSPAILIDRTYFERLLEDNEREAFCLYVGLIYGQEDKVKQWMGLDDQKYEALIQLLKSYGIIVEQDGGLMLKQVGGMNEG